MGTIQFDRKYGREIWKITSGEFSISSNHDKLKVNIWVESYYELIEKIEETGDTVTAVEIVFPTNLTPDFSEKFVFEMPKFEEVKDNWDEDKDYYCNWYYYEHRDVEDIKIEISKAQNKDFNIKITGMVEDPTDSNSALDTKLTIEFRCPLKNELNGYWVS
ncbi:MAG: hypothetical protein AAF990_14170 [Bacteroidota bacterium]